MQINRCLPPKKKLKILKDYSGEKDIVSYGVVQKVVKTGEGDEDFIVVDSLVETQRVNRQDYINSFKEDFDIYCVMKKVALTGDDTLLHSGGANVYMDTTKLPSTVAEYDAILKRAATAWDNLPADLKGKMSLSEFVDSFKDEQLSAYYAAKQQVTEGGAE